jgi:hypothetical protein
MTLRAPLFRTRQALLVIRLFRGPWATYILLVDINVRFAPSTKGQPVAALFKGNQIVKDLFLHSWEACF